MTAIYADPAVSSSDPLAHEHRLQGLGGKDTRSIGYDPTSSLPRSAARIGAAGNLTRHLSRVDIHWNRPRHDGGGRFLVGGV